MNKIKLEKEKEKSKDKKWYTLLIAQLNSNIALTN